MRAPSPTFSRLLSVSAAVFCLMVARPAHAQEEQADGLFVTVQNPITEGGIAQIKATIDRARTAPKRNIKTVVFDFNPEGKEAATENYGPCSDLADYIRSLAANGVTPIAFVHGKTTRHTVLPVIACEALVMSSAATIGEVASKERPVAEYQTKHYLELTGILRAGAVLKMIDKDVKLVQANYKGGVIYADLRKLDGPGKDTAYEGVVAIQKNAIPLPAGVALYNVEQARTYQLCILQAETRAEIRGWYKLSADSERGDDLGGEAVRACRIVLQGPINVPMRETIRRQIESAKAKKENTFFFVLECGGGDPGTAYAIANDLLALTKDPDYKARTIAVVTGKAPDLAIFIAFACQEIVMFKGGDPDKEAVLGDFETFIGDPARPRGVNVEILNKTLADIAEKRGLPKLLVDGMLDKTIAILQARNPKAGDRRLMSEAEFKNQPDKGWVQDGKIKEKGVLLKLTASLAKNLRVAKTIDNRDVNEAYALYGIEGKDVRSAEPSWLDDFATFLHSTTVSILLVIIGIAGLVLEMKAPGLIIPGVVAAICFVLFFWSQTQLGGQLIYLAIMLFVLGLVLLGIEIFLIPGFGITGVSGILLLLAGLVLAGVDKAPESAGDWVDLVARMLRFGLTMVGSVLLAFMVSRYLPKIPYANRLMLVPPEDKVGDDMDSSPLPGVDAAVSLLGQVGMATSMLRPAGMAKFGDRYVDVVTEGDFIQVGTPIQVVEVEGTRIVVKLV